MRQAQILVVYASGLIQGLALVAFPAASAIFTSPHEFNFSNSTYGSLFLPQAGLSILASLLSTKLTRSGKIKPVFCAGLAANLLSMSLLAASSMFTDQHSLAYGLLLFATASLGLGFGLTVPSINTFAELYFPNKVDPAILVLNTLLGLGTALAPALVALFSGMGAWWALPLILAFCSGILWCCSAALPFIQGSEPARSSKESGFAIPLKFWAFAAFALLYGISETINGNWATVYMSKSLGASAETASLALTCFWGMVTAGRVFFALLERILPPWLIFRFLPFVIAGAFIFISSLSRGDDTLGVIAFSLAGFGCSALLPLTISLGSQELTSIENSVAGGLIAFYLLGYGIAAFGAGQIVDLAGLSLGTVYGLAVFIALGLACLSFTASKEPKKSLAGTTKKGEV